MREARYCARPPFALHRLRHATPERPLSSPDARLVYTLPRPAHDGRVALRLAPLELLPRLARLIPPPRLHRHRYHGVFAPNSAWRPDVVRFGRETTQDSETNALPLPPGNSSAPCTHGASSARSRWARLLARVYEVNPLRCPSCHGEMRIVAFLTDPPVVRQILRHLNFPNTRRPSPRHEARRSATSLAVDPPSPFDLGSGAPSGRDPFDQSLPGDDGTWSA